MFKLYDEVYMCGNKKHVWKVVGFSENTVCDTNKLPMIKIISNGLITWAKQHELTHIEGSCI
ncbi:terminase large subunit [Bacillus phage SWEP1]|nr:terminase large subunit [Bacillus phage SWEP1]